ncbi:MAG: thymidylate kinase [Oscillospiraceae bacterium]|nr:thymidylate kinase [Oscillospiraceae bacterium]
MSKLFVIDGLDGSGKGTITSRLEAHFCASSVPVRRISFPMYDRESSTLVRMYLEGRLGGSPEDTGPYAASAMFALDRYISFRTDWSEAYHGDGIIIADRYTSANIVHQMTKIPREKWDEFIDWMLDFEHTKLGLPAPDKVIYLDMLPQLSGRNIAKRSADTGRNIDIHEKDTHHLAKSREAGLYAAARLGWFLVDSHENGGLRSLDKVFDEVLKLCDYPVSS